MPGQPRWRLRQPRHGLRDGRTVVHRVGKQRPVLRRAGQARTDQPRQLREELEDADAGGAGRPGLPHPHRARSGHLHCAAAPWHPEQAAGLPGRKPLGAEAGELAAVASHGAGLVEYLHEEVSGYMSDYSLRLNPTYAKKPRGASLHRAAFLCSRRYCYPRQAACKVGSNIFPDLSTPNATCTSLRIMAPMISLGALPAALSRWPKRLPQAVRYTVTMAGMYRALRRKLWPTFDMRGLPRTLEPDSCCRGSSPANATACLALSKRSGLA